MASIEQLLQYGKDALEQSGNEYAKYERKVLLEEVLQMTYMQMLVNPSAEVSAQDEMRYKQLIEKRCNHYPLQYILGYTHFMDYTFFVNENVLIPRNDTEVLVELADKIVKEADMPKEQYSVLDMCCGSGCIGISLKLYNKDIALTLCDISTGALEVTQKNLDKYNIEAEVTESNLFDSIDGTYSMIISNPPYIEQDVIESLMPEVKDYEPRLALDGGEDGLVFYRSIIASSKNYLQPGGYLLFEIGYNQGKQVFDMMEAAGFLNVTIQKDYSGLDRIVYGYTNRI